MSMHFFFLISRAILNLFIAAYLVQWNLVSSPFVSLNKFEKLKYMVYIVYSINLNLSGFFFLWSFGLRINTFYWLFKKKSIFCFHWFSLLLSTFHLFSHWSLLFSSFYFESNFLLFVFSQGRCCGHWFENFNLF